jgi:aldehyde:ferredoxin oxidoreductase
MNVGLMPQLLKAVTGIDFDDEKLMAIGDRIFTMKRAYITKIGISRKDDTLPRLGSAGKMTGFQIGVWRSRGLWKALNSWPT